MYGQQKKISNFQLLKKKFNAPNNFLKMICLPTLIINAQNNNNNILITYLPIFLLVINEKNKKYIFTYLCMLITKPLNLTTRPPNLTKLPR